MVSAAGAADTDGACLGEALIPVVNQIQDIFNEVLLPHSSLSGRLGESSHSGAARNVFGAEEALTTRHLFNGS
jgi:hypothetical protein